MEKLRANYGRTYASCGDAEILNEETGPKFMFTRPLFISRVNKPELKKPREMQKKSGKTTSESANQKTKKPNKRGQ